MVIQRLLHEAGHDGIGDDLVIVADDGFEAQADWASLGTPETYLGFEQAQNFVDGSPDRLSLNKWALSGDWTIESRASVLNDAGGRIRFRFHGRHVHLVLRAREASVPFRVLLEGEPPGDAHGLDVDEEGHGTLVQPRLYQLIRQPGSVTDRTFEIAFDAPGVEAYSFTFG
jgi:Thioredoxin like C-terminal domain